jgi:hypothetical protein
MNTTLFLLSKIKIETDIRLDMKNIKNYLQRQSQIWDLRSATWMLRNIYKYIKHYTQFQV